MQQQQAQTTPQRPMSQTSGGGGAGTTPSRVGGASNNASADGTTAATAVPILKVMRLQAPELSQVGSIAGFFCFLQTSSIMLSANQLQPAHLTSPPLVIIVYWLISLLSTAAKFWSFTGNITVAIARIGVTRFLWGHSYRRDFYSLLGGIKPIHFHEH
jgi:hypothetical protein